MAGAEKSAMAATSGATQFTAATPTTTALINPSLASSHSSSHSSHSSAASSSCLYRGKSMWAARPSTRIRHQRQRLLPVRSLYRFSDGIWRSIMQLRPMPQTIDPAKPEEYGITSNSGVVPGKDEEEQIASVTPDDADPAVLWEQRAKDVKAERSRRELLSPGFSFSAAGLIFPYHLGVCECLIERNYITENTPLAGSSAGALVCAVVAAGMSMQEALALTKELAEDCRIHGTAFRLGAVLRKVLERCIPEDAHVKSSGRIRVAITQVFRLPRGLLVDQFDSREELIDALLTSCFIPGYLAPRPVTIFRNRICIDGGFSLFMPPTAAETTIRVCAFSAKQLGLQGIVGISPDCNPENRATARQLFNWALGPAADAILDELYGLGYKDASVWASENPLHMFRSPPSLAVRE